MAMAAASLLMGSKHHCEDSRVTCYEGVDLDLYLDGSVRDHHHQPPTRTPYCWENETTVKREMWVSIIPVG